MVSQFPIGGWQDCFGHSSQDKTALGTCKSAGVLIQIECTCDVNAVNLAASKRPRQLSALTLSVSLEFLWAKCASDSSLLPPGSHRNGHRYLAPWNISSEREPGYSHVQRWFTDALSQGCGWELSNGSSVEFPDIRWFFRTGALPCLARFLPIPQIPTWIQSLGQRLLECYPTMH